MSRKQTLLRSHWLPSASLSGTTSVSIMPDQCRSTLWSRVAERPQWVESGHSGGLLSRGYRGQLLRMKTDLLDLLNQAKIVHPTRIVAVEASHHQLRITIAGYPWWRNDPGGDEEQIVFSFEGVREGLLDPETLLDMEEDEALEVFEVSSLSEEGWAESGTSYATYCSEPLPHPLKLYVIIEDYLWDAGAPRSARDYLNVPNGSLSHFCEIASTSSFFVAQAPQNIHDMILAELQRQNVSHNVLTSERASNRNLFVKIGGTSFVCERATAEM